MSFKLTKEFLGEMRELADKIFLGKLEPMEGFIAFNNLIDKHYRGKIDVFLGNFLYRMFSMYLQLYSLSRLGASMGAWGKRVKSSGTL